MSHWPILPILVPLVAAVALLLSRGPAASRALSLAATFGLVLVAARLLVLSGDGEIRAYRLGDWPAPYGIVLVLDRLAALMIALTAALAVLALLSAVADGIANARHFHVLFQLQVAGLNGAFLTGDLFNLFVFFELLLLASYALLAAGGGPERVRAGIVYVVLNLTGSALFLIALGLVYGTLGTLNLADVAIVLPEVAAGDQALIRTALALLVAVFLLKAAVLPLSFWLPHVYGAASAPVAALFAIMTKVGVYALLRLSVIGFGTAPVAAGLLQPWLSPLAVLTIVAGTLGALAARRLATVVANLVLVSTGTLLAAIAADGVRATAAALYYIPHTTLVTAGLFLLCGELSRRRGALADAIEKGPVPGDPVSMGGAFLVLTVAASGLPPLSGFLAKFMLLRALADGGWGPVLWSALLLSGLVAALVLARAASALFWEPGRPAPTAAAGGQAGGGWPAVALWVLAAASPLLALAAGPVARYVGAAAEQLHAREPYVAAVLGARPAVGRERRP